MSLTTLQLAERIAVAVIRAVQPAGSDPYLDVPTQAVLRTLRETSHWFCRVEQDEDGVINIDIPPVQLPLEIES